MKVTDIKQNSIKICRQYSLRKDTPQILKTLYIDRKGSLSGLKQKFGEDEVQKNIYLGNIKELCNDLYQTTQNGIETIKTFYAKQTPFQMLKSILFGVLSKPFQ